MKNLNSVDCMKLIMAYAVIAIHVSAICTEAWPAMFEWFIRLAVPFFFITSGYLLARKTDGAASAERSVVFRRQSLKLARLYGKWLLVYLPIAIYYFICVNPRPIVKELVQYVGMVVIDGESPYAWPLWFIYSMAIVMFVLSLMTRIKRPALLGFLVFTAIYLINCIDATSVALKIFDRLTVRSLSGGMYICAGMILYHVKGLPARVLPVSALLLGGSFVLFLLNLPFSPLLGGCGLFLAAITIRLDDSATYLRLRAASMWVYYIHMIVLFPLIVMKNCGQPLFNPYAALAYGIIASSLTAALLIGLSSRRGFRWLSALVK